MKKKRKLKKSVIITGIAIPIIIIIIIISVTMIKNYYKKINSYDYKLSKLGYAEPEIATIIKLKNNQIDKILNRKYSKVIPKFIKEKYFIFDNLDKYLDYYKEHNTEEKKHIVALVNVNANKDYYTNTTETNLNKNELMLVNKYNYLKADFTLDDLKNVSTTYCYGTQRLRSDVYNAFIKMFNAAKADEQSIIINSSYREYNDQKKLWDNYASAYGDEYADNYAARAGFSEHQTGLAVDLITYGTAGSEFDKTDEFKWLDKNAYKFGFILRYPKGKEDITGYKYESWHYRYVGIDVATKIKNLNITYDEYYAYYLK